MTEVHQTTFTLGIHGYGVCLPDTEAAQALSLDDADMELSLLPAMVRRRTSEATRVAISAATRACRSAGDDTDMSAVFVSAIGELQTTDKLCQSITEQAFPLSPTLFHNSVHNTAAGYWSIAAKSMAPMQAMAGLNRCVELGLLEAWMQLTCGAPRVLLVCYDETTPNNWLPHYAWQPCALALVLVARSSDHPTLNVPLYGDEPATQRCLDAFAERNPVFNALPLAAHLERAQSGTFPIALNPCHNDRPVVLQIP